MSDTLSRRRFLAALAAAGAAAALPVRAASGIRFGYAAITWSGKDAQAIEDISAVGFRGIQLRANAVAEWAGRPRELRDLLARRRLELVALSSGYVGAAGATEAEEVARHARHAAFVRDAGGRYLQVIDDARPKGRRATAADFARLGRVMTEAGKRSADLGVPLGYHHHMGSLGESPDEVARVMEAADRRHVKLVLDTAHYAQGGGDPARAVRRYRDDLLFLHVKDVEGPAPGGDAASYRFVELGRGRVDFPAVFAALAEVRFGGWAVVELDAVPDPARTPKESALVSRRYLEEKLGLKV